MAPTFVTEFKVVCMPELYPEDQDRVDEFLKSGVNDIERKPARLWLLLIIILLCLGAISLVGYFLAISLEFA